MGDSTKSKILYLLKYLFQHTDEEHKITTNELIEHLVSQGFRANRKTVKDDIDVLIVVGYDIVAERGGNNNVFYFGMRDFDLLEIKLMIDAVSSCKHIGVEQSHQLIEKLTNLESSHHSHKLWAHLNVEDRIKMGNDKVFYITDSICTALHANQKIKFQYYDFLPTGERVLRNNGE